MLEFVFVCVRVTRWTSVLLSMGDLICVVVCVCLCGVKRTGGKLCVVMKCVYMVWLGCVRLFL